MSEWREINTDPPEINTMVRIKLDNGHETVGERVGLRLWMFDASSSFGDDATCEMVGEMVGWSPLAQGMEAGTGETRLRGSTPEARQPDPEGDAP